VWRSCSRRGPPAAEDGFVDVVGAAAFLGLSPAAVRKLEARGEIRGYRPNGRVLFSRTELSAWARGGTS
jgi:excisionase family DNA binding protein